MLHMSKTLSPPKPSRVSVPVSGEVLEAFQRLAKAGNMSTGKAMAQWLEDTIDAAQFMAHTLEKARAAPRMVAQELHAYALGLSDETGELLEHIRTRASKERAGTAAERDAAQRARAAGGTAPPSCNTGGKGPKSTTGQRGGKSS
jgi:hypothetical protein